MLQDLHAAEQHTAAEYDDAGLARRGFHSFIVHGSYVSYDVKYQPRILECMEVQHVPKRTISQCWAVDRHIVLVGPVVDGVWMIDFLAKAMNHLQA